MSLPNIIAVDGPAGSGKSTVSFRLAERYGYLFIDTGVFYRTMTLVALQSRIDFTDTEKLTDLAEETVIEIIPQPDDPARQYSVLVNEQDVTEQIRTPEVERCVSTLSAIASVRHALVRKQRTAAAQGKIIMAGRDIGTVVLPDADVKLYIDASIEERARRRYLQKREKGQTADLAAIQDSLRQRDKEDSERDVSPLRQADDAIYIDTDDKTIEMVVDEISGKLELWPSFQS